MKVRVINPHAPHYGEIIDVDPVWTDSYESTDGDEISYGRDEIELIKQDNNQ